MKFKVPFGGGGVGGASISGASQSTRNTTPSVNQGIAQRSVANNFDNDKIVLQPTLVESDVTNKQKQSIKEKNTSVL
jgi:16S rRNA U1498 N3-methylase RsmE